MQQERIYNMPRERDKWLSAAFPALMRKVYVWMALALVITAVTAYGVASSPNIVMALYSNRAVMWGLIIAELAIVIGVSAAINRLSLTTATMLFILYSIINGAMLSSVFLVFSATVITKTFLVTAGTFGAMAVIGYTTKTDLTSMGKILLMGLIGLIIASVVNMFVGSTGFDLIISYVGVLIFVGLTAYDSQKIKEMLVTCDEMNDSTQKLALMGALTLYLDFINLFLYLLRIFGRSEK